MKTVDVSSWGGWYFLEYFRANTGSLQTGGMEVKCVVKRTNLRVRELHPSLPFQDLDPHTGHWIFEFVQYSCLVETTSTFCFKYLQSW